MSISCEKTFTITVAGCVFDFCADGDPIVLSQHLNTAGIAYDPDDCYLLVLTNDSGYTTTYFNRYDPDTDALDQVASVPVYFPFGSSYPMLVYDADAELFVYPVGGDIYTFDPSDETVANFTPATAITDSDCAIYVASNATTYLAVKSGGLIYVASIDYDSADVVLLGTLPTHNNSLPHYITYCPTEDALYINLTPIGSPGAQALYKFDLATNTATYVAAMGLYSGGGPSVWDSDRELLITMSSGTVTEIDTATDTIDGQYPDADFYVTGFYFYDSASKLAYLTAQSADVDHGGGQDVICAYDTQTNTLSWINWDYGVWSLCQLSGTGCIAASYDLVDTSIDVVRRLCLPNNPDDFPE